MASVVIGGRTKKVKIRTTKIKTTFWESFKNFFKKRKK